MRRQLRQRYQRRTRQGTEGGQTGGQTGDQKGGQTGGQTTFSVKPTQRQLEVLLLMRENQSISRKEISEQMNINESEVQKHIDPLRKRGIIDRKPVLKFRCKLG